MKRMIILAAVVASAAVSAWASGPEIQTSYGYHPRSVLDLGRGFDPNRVDLPKSACLGFASMTTLRPGFGLAGLAGDGASGGQGAIETEFDTFVVSNAQQYRTVFNIDLSAEASFLGIGGGSSFQTGFQTSGSSSSVTLVVRGRAEYARRFAGPPSVVPFAEEWLRAGNYEEFARNCGTHYVVMERRGAMVAARVTIEHASDELRATIASSSSVGGTFGPISGRVKAALNSELTRAAQSRSVHVQVNATGGTGLSGLSDIVAAMTGEADALSRISAALTQYMRQFTADNATPIGFEAAPIPFLPESISVKMGAARRIALLKMVDAYREVTFQEERLQALLSGLDPRAEHFYPAQLNLVRAELPRFDAYLSELRVRHQACLERAECEMDEFTLPVQSAAVLRTLEMMMNR